MPTRTAGQRIKNVFARALGKKTKNNMYQANKDVLIVPNLFEGYRVVSYYNSYDNSYKLLFKKHNPASADINDVFQAIISQIRKNGSIYDLKHSERHYLFIYNLLGANSSGVIDITTPVESYKSALDAYLGVRHSYINKTAQTTIINTIKSIDGEYNRKENVYNLVRSLRTDAGTPLIIRNTIKQRVKDFKNTLTRKVKGIPSAFMSLFPKLSRSNPDAAEQLLRVTETVNNLPAEQQTSLANALFAVTNAVIATIPVHAKPLNVAPEMRFPSLTGYNPKTKKSNSGTRISLTPRHSVSGSLEDETSV